MLFYLLIAVAVLFQACETSLINCKSWGCDWDSSICCTGGCIFNINNRIDYNLVLKQVFLVNGHWNYGPPRTIGAHSADNTRCGYDTNTAIGQQTYCGAVFEVDQRKCRFAYEVHTSNLNTMCLGVTNHCPGLRIMVRLDQSPVLIQLTYQPTCKKGCVAYRYGNHSSSDIDGETDFDRLADIMEAFGEESVDISFNLLGEALGFGLGDDIDI